MEDKFFYDLEKSKFLGFSSFLEICREASRDLLGWLLSALEGIRVSRNDFCKPKNVREKFENFYIFLPPFYLFNNEFKPEKKAGFYKF